MIWPLSARLSVSIDIYYACTVKIPTTHQNLITYDAMEKHWCHISHKRNVPPFIARCIAWDRINNQTTSHYGKSTMNINNLASIITDNSISIYTEGKDYCISSDNINFAKVKSALNDERFEQAIRRYVTRLKLSKNVLTII